MLSVLLGETGITTSAIGLGCSRLGSVLGADLATADRLLKHALDLGVTYFDTSDLYGQGDSERLLGRAVAPHPAAVICSKVGKRHNLRNRALIGLKRIAKMAARRSSLSTKAIANMRRQTVPTCFVPAYLDAALDRTLRRLGTERLDGLMLHGPTAEVVRRGDAIGVLEKARTAGKLRFIGVSVDDLECARECLNDPRIQALQIPLHVGERDWEAFAGGCAGGPAIVAREVLGGHGRSLDAAKVAGRLREAVKLPGVAVTLVGTTNAAHLTEAVNAITSIPASAQA
jgi:aryl-alcohol dehydrogenase-like predicted oxidoreductase